MTPMQIGSWAELESEWLAPYAVKSHESRGRRHAEPAHPFRTAFQRDRERIVHSSAFRRMTGKTQVLVATVNDHHRTRLTHTLEVAQIARTIARRLRLNEDLIEAIALAHDIGHPPFGHAGEEALHACLHSFGGFNHNLYGLRRVDVLEERYPEFPGLNLTFELREAFVRHSGMNDVPEAQEFQGIGQPPLEAQVVDVVDSIAYDTHDVDDALGLELISLTDLQEVTFWREAERRVRSEYAGLDQRPGHTLRTAVIRELIAWQVTDLIQTTLKQLHDQSIRNVESVREYPDFLIGFSPEIAAWKAEWETFLRARVYRHPRVIRMTAAGKRMLDVLFQEYTRSPRLMPDRHYRRWAGAELREPLGPGRQRVPQIERVVGDYLAGMTDRFAHQEFRRLFSLSSDP